MDLNQKKLGIRCCHQTIGIPVNIDRGKLVVYHFLAIKFFHQKLMILFQSE